MRDAAFLLDDENVCQKETNLELAYAKPLLNMHKLLVVMVALKKYGILLSNPDVWWLLPASRLWWAMFLRSVEGACTFADFTKSSSTNGWWVLWREAFFSKRWKWVNNSCWALIRFSSQYKSLICIGTLGGNHDFLTACLQNGAHNRLGIVLKILLDFSSFFSLG